MRQSRAKAAFSSQCAAKSPGEWGRGGERERTVLELRFGAELTQSEIAERIGVSQMQVSRILRRTLERLRELAEQPADTSAEDASSAEVGITVPLNGRRPRPRHSAAAGSKPRRGKSRR